MSDEFAELIAQLHGLKAEDAFFALISLPQSLPFVAAAYRRERRPVLIHCLWQYRDRAALATLDSALREDDDRVWKEALDALVTLGSDEAERVLRDTRSSLASAAEARAKVEWIDEAMEQIRDSKRPAEGARRGSAEADVAGTIRKNSTMDEPSEFAKLLTRPTNFAVVQLPGRRFPGVVFQGDSLHQLLLDLQGCAQRASAGTDVALKDELVAIVAYVDGVLRGYEQVLGESGIELPYPT